MKKFIGLTMAAMLLFGLTACGSSTETGATQAEETVSVAETEAEEEKPATITITALNGERTAAEVEVPYDPQRIAILDMPALDILDSLGLGDRIVGSAAVTIEYLTDYNPDDSDGRIMNLGTVKTADLEKVAACEPDVIFIGGRLSSIYSDLSAIAPVVFLEVNYEKGVVQSTVDNAKIIASMFGKEDEIDAKMEGFQERIDALRTVLEGKDVLLSMYNSNALGLLDTQSQLNIIARELGANNLGETVGEVEKATHGEEASWETIITLNPEYMFVLDRSTATGASDEEVMGAREVIENDLIKELDVYKDGKIVYFIEHANVWYTSTGGIQALDTMLADLEGALLN
ncbi:MAG: siderophore ABC transporter substrate-binding protein [Lachnospiraceae bacterium]